MTREHYESALQAGRASERGASAARVRGSMCPQDQGIREPWAARMVVAGWSMRALRSRSARQVAIRDNRQHPHSVCGVSRSPHSGSRRCHDGITGMCGDCGCTGRHGRSAGISRASLPQLQPSSSSNFICSCGATRVGQPETRGCGADGAPSHWRCPGRVPYDYLHKH